MINFNSSPGSLISESSLANLISKWSGSTYHDFTDGINTYLGECSSDEAYYRIKFINKTAYDIQKLKIISRVDSYMFIYSKHLDYPSLRVDIKPEYKVKFESPKEAQMFLIKNKIANGRYFIHSKSGNLYKLLNECKNSETLDEYVIYKSLYDGSVWSRPREMFFENVVLNGESVPRFKEIL